MLRVRNGLVGPFCRLLLNFVPVVFRGIALAVIPERNFIMARKAQYLKPEF